MTSDFTVTISFNPWQPQPLDIVTLFLEIKKHRCRVARGHTADKVQSEIPDPRHS